jgi:hypothetical protein
MHSNTVPTAFLSTTSHESLNAQSDNPFDPANLRLSQDFTEMAGVKKLLTTVPVRKPQKHDWFRVHPLPEYQQGPIGILTYGNEKEQYLVTPRMGEAMRQDARLQDQLRSAHHLHGRHSSGYGNPLARAVAPSGQQGQAPGQSLLGFRSRTCPSGNEVVGADYGQ